MPYVVGHYIGGKALIEKKASTLPLYNPAKGEVIGQVCIASLDACQKAIQAAEEAFPLWASTPALKRARILFNFRQRLHAQQSELAALVTREQGKTLEDAKGSVARAIELVEFHCGLMTQIQGSVSMNVAEGIDCMTIRQPLGVCFGVSPFNFPIMVPVWMLIPAIAAGNTFILKPSPQDPSASIRLLELLSEAGLPPGVVNCIQGDHTTVDYFLRHETVKACTAVASTPVAESIYKTAIAEGKRAHTFGGAKNHCVVMPDADLAYAAGAIVGAAFGASGERCMAISVVVAVGQVADALRVALPPLLQAININPGDVQGAEMGPLVSEAHRARVLLAIDAGVKEGAELVFDGRSFKHPTHPRGYFLGPCLFDHVQANMSIYQQEIFGPVLVMMRVDTLDEAIQLINAHQYGNGCALFTRDGFAARDFIARVQVGMVGVNIPIPVPIASHPFGGWKRSSFGDSCMHGQESMQFYTKSKSITSKWPETERDETIFAMPNHQ